MNRTCLRHAIRSVCSSSGSHRSTRYCIKPQVGHTVAVQINDLRCLTSLVHDTCRLYERKMDVVLPVSDWLHLFLNPSIRASVLFSLAASARRSYLLWRNILIRNFSCDLSRGAVLEGPILLPHPLGIVIGKGVRLGTEVTLYQGVTLGTDGTGDYPTIGANSVVYSGAVIVGDVVVAPGSRIKALEIISRRRGGPAD